MDDLILKQDETEKTIFIELKGGADIIAAVKQALELFEKKEKNIIFYHGGYNATFVISPGKYEVLKDD